MQRLKKYIKPRKRPFKAFQLQVDLHHYPEARFVRGTSIMVPKEHVETVYTSRVVEEKYWYWDEKGAALYLMMCDETGYDVLTKTFELLQNKMSDILKKVVKKFEDVQHTRDLHRIDLVVLGVGSARKENLIVTSLVNYARAINYVPVDISFPLLQNSLRSIFADNKMRECILQGTLDINPVLTDFLNRGLEGFLEDSVCRLIVAQGIVWNAPVPTIFDAFKRLMNSNTLLLIDVEFIGNRKDEEIRSNYEGKAAKDFFYHPLELLYKAAQTPYATEHILVNGNPILYREFGDFSRRKGKVNPVIVQRDTLDEFIKRYNLPEKARSKIRLSPDEKAKTVIMLYEPRNQKGKSKAVVLGYSTRFEHSEFEGFLKRKGFNIEGRWLDNNRDPQKAVFGSYLLSLAPTSSTDKKIRQEAEKAAPSKGDIIISPSPQKMSHWGVVGKSDGRLVKIDISTPHVVLVCGKMGYGKGYIINVLCEMLLGRSIPNILEVPEKAEKATLIVLHKSIEDEPSEFWSMTMDNTDEKDKEILKEEYDAEPCSLVSKDDVRIFVDPLLCETETIDKFKKDYGTDKVYPLGLALSSLQAEDLETILSIGTPDDSHKKILYYIIREELLKGENRIDHIKKRVQEVSGLTDTQRNSALLTLNLLDRYFVEKQDFVSHLALGGVNIFDFREKGKLTLYPEDLFRIMTLILSTIQASSKLKNKPIVLVINEAHAFFKKGISEKFVEGLLNIIRRYRYGPRWVILDTQLPRDIHENVIQLADVKIMYHFDKVIENKILRETFGEVADKLSDLKIGQAYIVAENSSEGKRRIRVNIRPRLTKHGTPTKTSLN